MKTDVVLEAKTKKYHLRYWDSLTWAAKNNRKKETESEKILWNKLLRKNRLGYKFTRQKPIGRFIADFYCSEMRLVIEIDGGSHGNKIERDKLRDQYLSCCGIRTIRVSDKDVMGDLDRVEELIRSFLPCQGEVPEGRVGLKVSEVNLRLIEVVGVCMGERGFVMLWYEKYFEVLR